MGSRQFFANPQFLIYARLLRQLHQLIRAHKDETEEGELLRARMDGPADFLTQEEVDCLNGISADFHTLAGPVPSEPTFPSQSGPIGDLGPLYSGDPVEALEQLRNDKHLDPAQVAYLRGRIWSRAREPEIALDFFQRAKDLAPQNNGYAAMWLDALSRVDSSINGSCS